MRRSCYGLMVNVTQEDIDNGVRGSSSHCPIALAMKRQLHKTKVSVCEDYNEDTNEGEIVAYRGNWDKEWKASKAVMKFVKAFDNDKQVKPHRFRLKNGSQSYEPPYLFNSKKISELYSV